MNNSIILQPHFTPRTEKTLTISGERREKQEENDGSGSVSHAVNVLVTLPMLSNADKIEFVLKANKQRFNYSTLSMLM